MWVLCIILIHYPVFGKEAVYFTATGNRDFSHAQFALSLKNRDKDEEKEYLIRLVSQALYKKN